MRKKLSIIPQSQLAKNMLCALMLMGSANLTAADNPVIDTSSVNLVDETGKPVQISDYNDYLRLVFFGFTHCPDICPITLFNVATALKSLKEDAKKVRILFISVDPKRDSPDVLAQYTDAFHASIIGMTGSYDQIARAAKSFRTTFGYSLRENGKERTLDKEAYLAISPKATYAPYHSSQIYILDAEGDVADIIGYGSKPEFISEKIREHLHVERTDTP